MNQKAALPVEIAVTKSAPLVTLWLATIPVATTVCGALSSLSMQGGARPQPRSSPIRSPWACPHRR